MVRIASVRPPCRLTLERERGASIHPADLLSEVMPLIETAAREGADIACLPEDAFFMMQAAHVEPRDGAVFRALKDAARRLEMSIAVGLVCGREGKAYNATVLFSHDGDIAGEYHKTHLTLLEKKKYGISPGNELPVFDLPFGRVGVITCCDILFPEVARVLALRGAKLFLFPHQMAEPDDRFFMTMVQARAQDNCVPIVGSTFADEPGRHWYRSAVIDSFGKVVELGPLGVGVTIADVELNVRPQLCDYIEPGPIDLWNIIQSYRRPELYKSLAQAGKTSEPVASTRNSE
jgi:deaminated glutathione amidase